MKVVLVNPTTGWKAFQHILPLGIAYLAAVLEKAGTEVEIIDFRFTNREPVEDCIPLDADVIGFSALTFQFPFALEVCKSLRRKGYKGSLVFGGAHASAVPLDLIGHEEIDAVFVGEAEESFLLYLDYLKGKEKKENLVRTYLSTPDGIFQGKKNSWIASLDSLPFPARHFFPMSTIMEGDERRVNIVGTRGCPYKCNYCQPLKETLFGKKIRRRSVENILAEVKHCKDKYDITNFGIVDDTFTFNRKYVAEFCNRLIESQINVSWGCQTRSDICSNVLELMKKSGCEALWIGIESGSQTVLDRMNKGTSVAKNKEFLKTCKALGITTLVNMMVGYPGETEEDLKKSVAFIEETNPDQVAVSQVTPFPGTHIYMSDDVIKQDYAQVARHVFAEKFKSISYLQDKIVDSAMKMTKVLEGYDLDSADGKNKNRWASKIPLSGGRVFIFGASTIGRKVAEILNKKSVGVEGYMDNYIGGHVNDIPVKKPFKPDGNYFIILASINFHQAMRKQLEHMGASTEKIFDLLV